MFLQKLSIHDFRNIEQAEILLNPGFNAFFGENGSGKTSVLEAIYYLAMAKSFRSNYSRYVIRDQQKSLFLYAESNKDFTLGMSKPRSGDLIMKHNGEIVQLQGEWVKLLPVLICHHETYQLLDAGPKVRRQFIDWGVFHVKHDFFKQWQVLQKVLKQRNSGLRAELPTEDICVWDAQLIEATTAMTALRREFLEEFLPIFSEILEKFVVLGELSVEFTPGWPEDQDYATVLKESLYRDRQYGYTRYGPQRADLKFCVDGKPADEVLSRGQQKVFVAALKLAQGRMLRSAGKSSLFLFDDLPSELDEDKQGRLVEYLRDMQSQVFITGIQREAVDGLLAGKRIEEKAMFHVKHGVVEPV